ncbi:FBD-associated F-box protein [Trifolium repens]|nr:FBD-associated F-box protein [Trifolium repens]
MAEEEEDIINTLPDAVLCHILSFLETKQYVATSIISKRWNNLWRSVPAMDLGHTVFTDQNAYLRFIHFVYSVLLSRDSTLPITNFELSFAYHNYQILTPHNPMDCVTKWVNFVVQRGVQYIDLSAGIPGFPKLPSSVLTCSTLVDLKIYCFNVEVCFSPVILPSLKTLHLEHIWFDELRDFMLFLAGSPLLEDLYTLELSFGSEESLTCDEWKSFCLSNLTEAVIDCFHFHFRCRFPLKVVYNVSSLCLEIDQVNCHNDFIHTFHNLTQLEFDCCSLHYNWKLVLELLNHCPKLQSLRLSEVVLEDRFSPRNDDNENWVDPDFVPQCLSLHLRTCHFSSFLGRHGTELMLALYILKHARVLQTMTIYNSGERNISRQFFSCPIASDTCELDVCYSPCK